MNTRSRLAGSRDTIRAFFVELVVGAVAARGCPTAPLLRRHGLSPSDIASPYAWVPLGAYLDLFEDAAALTACPDLGRRLGGRFELAMLGPFAALMQQAATLGEALALYGKFQRVWQSGTQFTREPAGPIVRFVYRIDAAAPHRQDAEFTLSALVALARLTVGPDWSPTGVGFQHDGAPEPGASAFGAALRFGEPSNWIAVPSVDLDRPIPGRTPSAVTAILERHLLDLLGEGPAARSDDVVTRTSAIVDRCLGVQGLCIEDVAHDLNLSTRTLRRRLEAEGTSFRALLQARRMARAEALLRNGPVPLADLAEQLGYADATVFARAFRAWTGSSPRRFAIDGPTGAD